MKQIKKRLAAWLLAIVLLASGVPEALAADGEASSMQLTKTEGTATVSSSSGKSISVIKNMRLYNGYQLETAEKSYLWISLDKSRLAKMDAASKASIRAKGKKQEILLDSGNIFFNISEPLDDDESLNIATSTMVVGIRGTCGWVKMLGEKICQVSLLEGCVEITVTDPVTGQKKTAQISGGETATCVVYETDKAGDKCDIIQENYSEEDIDGFVLKELLSDDSLVEEIYEKSGVDLRDITPAEADARVAKREQEVGKKLEDINTTLEDQTKDNSTAPAWEKDNSSKPEPDNTAGSMEESKPDSDSGSSSSGDRDDSGSSGSGDNDNNDDGSSSTPSEVPSTLPATASVPEINAALRVHDAVTVGNGSASITLRESLSVPSGKTLSFNGPFTVVSTGGLTVNGTANVLRDLTNSGTITVNSSNTLNVTGSLVNNHILLVTSTGRLVVGENYSGALTPTLGAAVRVGSYSDVTLPENWKFTQSGGGCTLEYHEPHTVTFNSSGGSTVPGQTVPDGKTAAQPANPTRENYTFTGWYTDEACTIAYDFSTSVTADLTLYAGWTPVTLTVSFNSNGGSAVSAQTVQSGETVSQPANPTRDGYIFAGWYTDEACENTYDFSTPVTANLTLYAGWTPAAFMVSFNSNGGSAVSSQTVQSGETVSQPAAPTREDYTFTGWYTDAACTNTYSFSAPVTGNLTLYAGWEAIPQTPSTPPAPPTPSYTVTFDSMGGSAVASQTIQSGGTVSRPNDPDRDGYTLTGWFTDEAGSEAYDFPTPITGNLTLYAAWEFTGYIVRFETFGGSEIDSQIINPGGGFATSPTPTRDGYAFDDHWYTDLECTQPYNFEETPVNASLTLYAGWLCKVVFRFQLEENEKAYLPNGTTEVTDGVSDWCKCGKTFGTVTGDMTGFLRTGYTFLGWSLDPGGPVTDDSTLIEKGGEVYAQWEPKTYKVSFALNGGSGSIESIEVKYKETTEGPGIIPTRDGYTFDGWYTDLTDPASFSFATPITGDLVLHAKWTFFGYTVMFDTGGGSAVLSRTDIAEGGLATEPDDSEAPTHPYFVFGGWYTDEACTQLYDFDTPVYASLTLYAKWRNPVVTFFLNFGTGYGIKSWDSEALAKDYTVSTVSDATVSVEVPKGAKLGDYWVTPVENYLIFDEPDKPATHLTFEHWSTWPNEPESGGICESDMVVEEDTPLYAAWSWTITFLDADDPSREIISPKSVFLNKYAVEPSVSPGEDGYSFVWYTTPGADELYYFKTTSVTGNLTLYGKKTFTGYTVMFDDKNGNTITKTADPSTGEVEKPADPTLDSCVFKGWYLDGEETQAFDLDSPVTKSIVLYAKWQCKIQFNFQVLDGEKVYWSDGTTEVEPGISNFCDRDDLFTTAVAGMTGITRPGYIFKGWSLNPSGPVITDGSSTTIEKSVTVYAIWEPADAP